MEAVGNDAVADRWTSKDALGRPGRSWNSFFFVRSRQDGVGDLKRIASIITEDRKTSTYKLALPRFLCEVALSSERAVTIDVQGVHAPLKLLAERWLAVYWPLLASPVRAPQSSAPMLAFEKELLAFDDAIENGRLIDALRETARTGGAWGWIRGDPEARAQGA